MRLTPFHVGLLLLGATAAVLGLHLVDPHVATRDFISTLEWGRLLIGLPVVLFVPGYFLAPFLFRRDVRPEPDGKARWIGARDPSPTLDLIWTLFGAFGLNIFGHAVHFNVLRVAGAPIEWGPLLGFTLVEALVGCVLLRARLSDARFAPSSAPLRVGLAVAGVTLFTFFGLRGPDLTADSSWYFYTPALEQPWQPPSEDEAFRIERTDGEERREDRMFRPPERIVPYRITNESDLPVEVPVFFLVHGRMGLQGELSIEGEAVVSEQLGQLVKGEWSDAPVERYWEWGTMALTWRVEIPAGGDVLVELRVLPFEPGTKGLSEVAIIDWSGLGSDELVQLMKARGIHHTHPFQLLNVTENVRWAAEVASTQAFAGRSPDGTSHLHQPPAWTYLYAPARQMLTPQLVVGSFLFCFIILAIVAVVLKAAEAELVSGGQVEGKIGIAVGAALGLAVAMNGIQHTELITSDASMNFPDTLYALGLVGSVVLLVAGRFRMFLLWAALAALLRYPGAVVVGLAALTFMATDKQRRALVTDAIVKFVMGLCVFCGAMLIAAIASESLEAWLFALYFETVPEHFNNNPDALPLLRRPLEFFKYWGRVGGIALLFALPLRGTMARTAFGTALLYAPFLMFIDHFSSHYFLPLIALASLVAVTNIARAQNDYVRVGSAVALAAACSLAVAVALY